VPVLNEEKDLPTSTGTLHRFLSDSLGGYEWRILIADNGSTDSTLDVAEGLAGEYDRVGYISLDKIGRGRALRRAWLESNADILAYMDVDLSTELGALPRLVIAIDTEDYDLAIGSRLKKGAQVVGRPPHRELISRAYSLIFRSMFLTGFLDAQCGFKAISRRAAQDLLPLVKDNGWFFDSELLILAESNGYRIKEIPVRWTDDPDSRVRIVRTAYEDMKGLLRLRFGGLRRASRHLSGGDRGQ
jgi:glycosyltransferase involved in cell wall biosynthesis